MVAKKAGATKAADESATAAKALTANGAGAKTKAESAAPVTTGTKQAAKAEPPAKDKYLLSSVNNTLGLLDVLAKHGSMSLAELARTTGHDKASLFRMMHTLEANGFVSKDEEARYSLGLKLLYLGGSVVAHQDLTEVARPRMMAFCREKGISVHLARLSGTRVVTTEVETPAADLQVTGRIGMSARVHSTAMGRAILANIDEAEVARMMPGFKYVAYTPRSIQNDEELLAVLEKVRAEGYATDINDRYQGFGSIAAPIFDFSGRCVAACGIVTLAQAVEENLDAYAADIRELARAISADLGAQG